jgi:hypothetical protein
MGAVHRQRHGPDDRSGRERDRKRRGAQGGQGEAGRSGDHHAVDHRDHVGGGQRELPSARPEPTAVQALAGPRARDEEVRFQLGGQCHVQVPQARDPLSVCDVLERGLNQALKVTTPTNASTGNRIRANAKKSVPSRDICPMKASAIRLLDTAAR